MLQINTPCGRFRHVAFSAKNSGMAFLAEVSTRSRWMLLCVSLLALVFSALTYAEPVFASSRELTVEFQKGVPCAVRVINEGSETDAGPWLLEFTPRNGPKATLRLPLQGGAMQIDELRAASFVAPEKRELFLSFRQVRNGIFGWAYVVDFSNGEPTILFDGDWLLPGFAAQGAFADGYRVEFVFPELFDRYWLYIKDEKNADYASLYDAKDGRLKEARAITGSYPTRYTVAGPDERGLFALEAVLTVTGAATIDVLGEYAFQLRYQGQKPLLKGGFTSEWRLHGDTRFTSEQGHCNRREGATPVADMKVRLTANGLGTSLPPPLALVTKVSGQKKLDELPAAFGAQLAGTFVADAKDTWFFLPVETPLTVTVHKVETSGGSSEATDILESYSVQAGQKFVYSGNQMAWNKDTESMEPQFVIAVSHEPSGRQHFLWYMPANENDALSPGFAPLNK